MANPPGKKMIPVYIDETIYREIKVYSAQTDQHMQQVIKPLSDAFEQLAIKLVTDIHQMKKEVEDKKQREEEEAQIVAEHPMQVSGKQITSADLINDATTS